MEETYEHVCTKCPYGAARTTKKGCAYSCAFEKLPTLVESVPPMTAEPTDCIYYTCTTGSKYAAYAILNSPYQDTIIWKNESITVVPFESLHKPSTIVERVVSIELPYRVFIKDQVGEWQIASDRVWDMVTRDVRSINTGQLQVIES